MWQRPPQFAGTDLENLLMRLDLAAKEAEDFMHSII